ncbi:hypothetical protein AQS8620_00912 [Aquimixticola soesokkakensis]|uniref:Uncharacterized protein n=1 Tax=Aquimixticola soesokkakensis TaxID=1519096 RepID=A0A1Y5S0R9_9RHOB|nr:hypothetical protein [Aquimixticola soesokkakensis]SLN29453.1 hypothetical protein AQS8620_00912 [Aquimixticola soesokkakensis]
MPQDMSIPPLSRLSPSQVPAAADLPRRLSEIRNRLVALKAEEARLARQIAAQRADLSDEGLREWSDQSHDLENNSPAACPVTRSRPQVAQTLRVTSAFPAPKPR